MSFSPSWRGLQPYADSLQQQMQTHAHVIAGGEPLVLGFEHTPVITLGVRGRTEADVSAHNQIPLVKTDRGGQATLHSPGQLVIYPILPLKKWGIGPRDYVCSLLLSTKDFLRDHGIEAATNEDRAGVYVEDAKIAFCGLRLDRGVSRHGLSLNIRNDLRLFQGIRPCGRSEESLVRAQDLSPFFESLSMEEVFEKWFCHFKLRFSQLVLSGAKHERDAERSQRPESILAI